MSWFYVDWICFVYRMTDNAQQSKGGRKEEIVSLSLSFCQAQKYNISGLGN